MKMKNYFLSSDIKEIIEKSKDITSQFSGKTMLISGGAGFIGRYFVEVFRLLNDKILEKPCKLIVIDNFITADTNNKFSSNGSDFNFITHDIIEPLEIDEPLHFIAHAAGIASPHYYRAHPLETLDVGVTGTRNMFELANKHNARFLFFSSSEIYGDPDPSLIPIEEGYRGNVSSQGPRSCYDESKRVGETLCYIFHKMFGNKTNIVRPFNVFGPGMKENDFRVLSNFGNRIKAKKPLKIYGSGKQTRTYCYIVDAMNGFLRTLVKGIPGETYNIGNPEPEISVFELAEKVKKIMGNNVVYNVIGYPDDYPGDEPKRRCPDIRKARIQLDYIPQVDLNDGLKRFFNWTQSNYTGKQ